MSLYKTYPQGNLIKDWDQLLKLSREEVVALYEQWKEIQQENEEKEKQSNTAKYERINEVAAFLKSKGIEVYKYKKSSFFKEKNGYLAWFKKNVVDEISKKYPHCWFSIPTAHMGEQTVNGITLYNNQSPTNLVELYDRLTHQYGMKKRENEKVDQLLIKSIEYATKHQINIENFSSQDIITAVSEQAIEAYLEENLPHGTEVYLKHECDECSTYFMGDHRCSCGNRRISIAVEGDIIKGFYHYPEGY